MVSLIKSFNKDIRSKYVEGLTPNSLSNSRSIEAIEFPNFIARSIFKSLEEYGDVHIFNITKKDQDRQGKLKKERKYAIIKLILMGILTVITNIFFMFLEKILF